MNGQTVILHSQSQRDFAKRLIDKAPPSAVLNIRPARRTKEQSDRMWAMLSDISRAKPEGRIHTPQVWKCIFLNMLGHEMEYIEGLNGEVFPLGFHSSELSVKQMTDLIETLFWYGATHGLEWGDEIKARHGQAQKVQQDV